MRTLLALVLGVVLAGAQCGKSAPPPPALGKDQIQVQGTLTDEGAECQALRSTKGELYTLSGSLGGFHTGNQVCVRGRTVEISTCQQGITLAVDWIGPRCP